MKNDQYICCLVLRLEQIGSNKNVLVPTLLVYYLTFYVITHTVHMCPNSDLHN